MGYVRIDVPVARRGGLVLGQLSFSLAWDEPMGCGKPSAAADAWGVLCCEFEGHSSSAKSGHVARADESAQLLTRASRLTLKQLHAHQAGLHSSVVSSVEMRSLSQRWVRQMLPAILRLVTRPVGSSTILSAIGAGTTGPLSPNGECGGRSVEDRCPPGRTRRL